MSYAHKDSSVVYPQLVWLKQQGFNVWYDEGVQPGSEWSNELADAIQHASAFLFFITPNSVASSNCTDEVSYALDNHIPLLAVHLEESQLASGMQMRLNRHQAVLKFELEDSRYKEKLCDGLAKLLKSEPITVDESSQGFTSASFFEELKRRNVVRIGIGYLAVSWFLVQLIATIAPEFGFDDLTRESIIVLAIGFIPVLVLAWAYQLTPLGLVLDKHSRTLPDDERSKRTFDRLIIAVLILALSYFVFDEFLLQDSEEAQRVVEESKSNEANTQPDEIIIAVLPFKNISAESENAFFTSGVHEDVLAHLSKIRGLKVISRTSVMAYESQDAKTAIQIASELGVNRILEGSVRRAGQQVRINVQLIDAKADTQIWSEVYDRVLSDIFVIQSEVAKDVAAKLHVVLDPETLARVDRPPTESLLAYDLYTRAQNAAGSLSRTKEAIELLERAILEAPDFADAHAALAKLLLVSHFYGADLSQLRDRAYELSRKAIQLNPLSSAAHESLGFLLEFDGEVRPAIQAFERAIELNPSSSFAYQYMSTLKRDEFRMYLTKAVDLDPLNEHALVWLTLRTVGSDAPRAEKERLLERLKRLNQGYFYYVALASYKRFIGDQEQAFRAFYTSLVVDKANLEALHTVFILYGSVVPPGLKQRMLDRAVELAPNHFFTFDMKFLSLYFDNPAVDETRIKRFTDIFDEWKVYHPEAELFVLRQAQFLAAASRRSLALENVALANSQRQSAVLLLENWHSKFKERGNVASDVAVDYALLLREDGQLDKAEALEMTLIDSVGRSEEFDIDLNRGYAWLAFLHASRGERDEALTNLDAAFQYGGTIVYEVEAKQSFDWLRDDVRFMEIMERARAREVELAEYIAGLDLEPLE